MSALDRPSSSARGPIRPRRADSGPLRTDAENSRPLRPNAENFGPLRPDSAELGPGKVTPNGGSGLLRRARPAHWFRTDAIIAAVLAMAGVELAYLSNFAGVNPESDVPVHVVALAAILFAAPLAWRRRAPLIVAVLVSALYITLGSLGAVEFYASQVVLFMAFYSVGAWTADRRRARQVRIVIVLAMAGWLVVAAIRGFTDPETGERGVNAYFAFLLIQWLVNATYFAGAWLFGDRAWAQALEHEELARAHAEIRAQQDELARQAVTRERLRIARELHDVVAHHVTAMGVQAGAGRMLLHKDPEAAVDHLRGVEDSARQAVGELQTLVHTLRDDDAGADSLPRLTDLEGLVVQARTAGRQTVDLTRIGAAPDLPAAAELVLYRVAQEGLTNARKHAGPRAQVQVRLRTEADRVELEVSDDGRGSATAGRLGTRMGLTGMRERIDSVGGTLEVGPKPHGGWLVRATVPTTTGKDSA